MDFRFLYHRVRYFILFPSEAWKVVKEENRPLRDVRNSFFLPLIIIISVCAFLGSLLFTNTTLPPLYSVFMGLKSLLLHLLAAYASAIVLGEITRALDLGRDFVISFKMIVYSLAPLYFCQMVSLLLESLVFVNILSLYGLYLFWNGIVTIFNPPEHKRMPMLVATFAVVSGFFLAFSILLSNIIDRIYFAFFA